MELAATRLFFFSSSISRRSQRGFEKKYLSVLKFFSPREQTHLSLSRHEDRKKTRPILSFSSPVQQGRDSSMPYGEAPWIFTGRCVSPLSWSVGHECGLEERESSGRNSSTRFPSIDFAGQTSALLFFFFLPLSLNLDRLISPPPPPKHSPQGPVPAPARPPLRGQEAHPAGVPHRQSLRVSKQKSK